MKHFVLIMMCVMACTKEAPKSEPMAAAAPEPVVAAAPKRPATLALSATEKRHEPAAELPWKPSGRELTATLVDYRDDVNPAQVYSKLVIWGDGVQSDIVKTGECASAVLRPAPDQRIVFRCVRNIGDTVSDDWLIRWDADGGRALRYRHWQGGLDEREPRWAMASAAEARAARRRAKDKRTNEVCCCDNGAGGVDRLARAACAQDGGKCVSDADCMGEE